MPAGVRVLLCLVVLAAGCADPAPDLDAMTLSDACAAPEPQTVQGGSHLLGDTEPPVPYLSDPGTSGWHASGGGPASGSYAGALGEPEQVAVLERGGVVVAFDPGLAPSDAGALLELGAGLDPDLDVVVTPHVRPLPTAVTLTGWGVLARCSTAVTADDVRAFAVGVRAPGGH